MINITVSTGPVVSSSIDEGVRTYFCDHGEYNDMATLFFNSQEEAIKQLFHQKSSEGTVLPAKSDSDVMFCLQNYQGLRIDISLVY